MLEVRIALVIEVLVPCHEPTIPKDLVIGKST